MEGGIQSMQWWRKGCVNDVDICLLNEINEAMTADMKSFSGYIDVRECSDKDGYPKSCSGIRRCYDIPLVYYSCSTSLEYDALFLWYHRRTQ